MSLLRSTALAAGLIAGAPALAAPMVSPVFTSDLDFTTYLADNGVTLPANEAFVAQARGGRPGAADYELGLHIPPSFTSAAPVGTAGQQTWVNGGYVRFALTRSGDTVTFEFGSYSQSWTDDSVSEVDALGIRAGAIAGAGNQALIRNLAIDGTALAETSLEAADGTPELLVVYGFEDSFVLTGELALAWIGSLPTGSRLAMQIKGIDGFVAPGGGDPTDVPAPAALGLFGLGLLGFAAARRRRG